MSDQQISVGFFCQRCLQPIKLDHTFLSIGEHNLAELSLPIQTPPNVDLESDQTNFNHLIPAYNLIDSGNSNNGGNGFTILSAQGEPGSLSHKLKVTADLFDIVSSNSEVDHPLCEECTDSLLDLLDQQLKLTEDELSDYIQFHKRLLNENVDVNLESLEKELKDLQSEEERLFSELNSIKIEEEKILKELSEQEKIKERLDKDEEIYWKEYSKHRHEYILIEDEQKSLENRLSYVSSHLDKLKKTNVFNATFHIWHSGHFGTINNFRLGRLPSAPVEWSEINAAWGQTALLLNSLATKMNLKFDKYKLVPYGNHSYIQVLSEQKELPLHASGGIRFLWDTKFDSAMVAFLDCLQQFKEEVEKGDSGFLLPYKIDKGKFEDTTGHSYSIKIQFNSEEQWTKALKFLLTNLKWGLAWVSSQFAKEQNALG